jgi:hypothetical protein
LDDVRKPDWGSWHTCEQLAGPEAGLQADGNEVLGPILDPPGQEQHEPEAVCDGESFNHPSGCRGKAQGEERLIAAVAELGAPIVCPRVRGQDARQLMEDTQIGSESYAPWDCQLAPPGREGRQQPGLERDDALMERTVLKAGCLDSA